MVSFFDEIAIDVLQELARRSMCPMQSYFLAESLASGLAQI